MKKKQQNWHDCILPNVSFILLQVAVSLMVPQFWAPNSLCGARVGQRSLPSDSEVLLCCCYMKFYEVGRALNPTNDGCCDGVNLLRNGTSLYKTMSIGPSYFLVIISVHLTTLWNPSGHFVVLHILAGTSFCKRHYVPPGTGALSLCGEMHGLHRLQPTNWAAQPSLVNWQGDHYAKE